MLLELPFSSGGGNATDYEQRKDDAEDLHYFGTT
jgi:hypothetical protein